MANTAGALSRSLPITVEQMPALLLTPGLIQTGITLDGTLTVDKTYPNIIKVDPGGANRDVTLDAESDAYEDLVRIIVNAADAAENLVCKDADGNTIATINQNEAALLVMKSNAWTLVFVFTIALS